MPIRKDLTQFSKLKRSKNTVSTDKAAAKRVIYSSNLDEASH